MGPPEFPREKRPPSQQTQTKKQKTTKQATSKTEREGLERAEKRGKQSRNYRLERRERAKGYVSDSEDLLLLFEDCAL